MSEKWKCQCHFWVKDLKAFKRSHHFSFSLYMDLAKCCQRKKKNHQKNKQKQNIGHAVKFELHKHQIAFLYMYTPKYCMEHACTKNNHLFFIWNSNSNGCFILSFAIFSNPCSAGSQISGALLVCVPEWRAGAIRPHWTCSQPEMQSSFVVSSHLELEVTVSEVQPREIWLIKSSYIPHEDSSKALN